MEKAIMLALISLVIGILLRFQYKEAWVWAGCLTGAIVIFSLANNPVYIILSLIGIGAPEIEKKIRELVVVKEFAFGLGGFALGVLVFKFDFFISSTIVLFLSWAVFCLIKTLPTRKMVIN